MAKDVGECTIMIAAGISNSSVQARVHMREVSDHLTAFNDIPNTSTAHACTAETQVGQRRPGGGAQPTDDVELVMRTIVTGQQ
jgi:hypothetical protein